MRLFEVECNAVFCSKLSPDQYGSEDLLRSLLRVLHHLHSVGYYFAVDAYALKMAFGYGF